MIHLLLAMLAAMIATSASASGVDLTVNACPGHAGASNDAGTLDCAGGATLALLTTFQPVEPINDLASVNVRLRIDVPFGDVNYSASFWDLQVANSAALSVTPNRPVGGCSAYLNTFGGTGSGSAALGRVVRTWSVEVGLLAYAAAPVAVTANQKLFAMQVLLDLSTSIEAIPGGSGNGCNLPVTFEVIQLTPVSASNAAVTPLTWWATREKWVVANGAASSLLRGPEGTPNKFQRLRSMFR